MKVSLFDGVAAVEALRRGHDRAKLALVLSRSGDVSGSNRELVRLCGELWEALVSIGAPSPEPRKALEAGDDDPGDPTLWLVECVGPAPLWRLRRSFLEELEARFPELVVIDEIHAALTWIDADRPRRMRKAKKMELFLNEWCRRRVASEKEAHDAG